MTDRFKGCVVTFSQDIREDDAAPVLAAIMHIKGVVGVEGVTANVDDTMNRRRVHVELVAKILDLLKASHSVDT